MPKKRVLVIDDEAGFTRMLKLHLEEAGPYEVETENHAAQALAAVRAFKPDLILLDIVMPDMDGTEIAAQFREDGDVKGTPIVFLTAVIFKEELGGSSRVIGGHPFLAKPVEVKEVIACCIEKHLKPA